jgi:hypothetical protein
MRGFENSPSSFAGGRPREHRGDHGREWRGWDKIYITAAGVIYIPSRNSTKLLYQYKAGGLQIFGWTSQRFKDWPFQFLESPVRPSPSLLIFGWPRTKFRYERPNKNDRD